MLTPDVMIDRRILIEAETLVEQGYEVFVLASRNEKAPDFEVKNGVKIQRISYDGIDPRARFIYYIQYKIVGRVINTMAYWVNRVVGYITRSRTKTINTMTYGVNKSVRLVAPGVNKFIIFGARTMNFFFQLWVKSFCKLFWLSGYDLAFYEGAVRLHPDIIHVHDLPMLKTGYAVKKNEKCPMIYDMHEFYPEQRVFQPKIKRKLRRIEKKYIKEANGRISVNPKLASLISETYRNVPIVVIQNATVIPENFPVERQYRLHNELGLSHENIILLYQGWMSPDRNLQNLVAGMANVKNKRIKLVLMGYGDFVEDLKQIARDAGVEDRVYFVPSKSQEELLYYTASADVGLIPYPFSLDPNTRFASPNKLYEFIAVGLPILCNKLPFVEEVVVNNGFGVSYELDSAESFGQAINSFPFEELDKFRDSLKVRKNIFLWDSEASKLIDMYDLVEREKAEKI